MGNEGDEAVDELGSGGVAVDGIEFTGVAAATADLVEDRLDHVVSPLVVRERLAGSRRQVAILVSPGLGKFAFGKLGVIRRNWY